VLGNNLLGDRFGGGRILYPGHLVTPEVCDDLFAEGQNSVLVTLLVLVNMDRRDIEGIVFFVGISSLVMVS